MPAHINVNLVGLCDRKLFCTQRSRGALTNGGNTSEYADAGYHQLSPHSHHHRASYRATKVPTEFRGKGLWDGTSPVRGWKPLGEEPEVRKGKNHSVLRRNKHGKARAMMTRGTGHL